MVSRSDLNLRRSVADETSVHLDVCTRRRRIDLQLGGCRSGGLILTAGIQILVGGRLELRQVHFHITVYVGGNLRPLRDADVLAVHKQKERSGREENEAGSNHSTNHRAGVAAALGIPDGA